MRSMYARSPLSLVAAGLTFALAGCSDSPTAPMTDSGRPALNVVPIANGFTVTSGGATTRCGAIPGDFIGLHGSFASGLGTANDLTGALGVYNPGWSLPVAGSSWIGAQPDANEYTVLPGAYCFEDSFTLPVGATASTINLDMKGDNVAIVYLNGSEILRHTPTADFTGVGDANWNVVKSISTGLNFIPGLNKLRVVLINTKIGPTVPALYTCFTGPQAGSAFRGTGFPPFARGWTSDECRNPSAVSYGATVMYTPAPVIVGNQGCSHGYWKNKGRTPANNALMSTVFMFLPSQNSTANQTLQQGLEGSGRGIENLMKQAVASYFNSMAVNYPLSTAGLITRVNAALATNNAATMNALANTLDGFNNLHNAPICPN